LELRVLRYFLAVAREESISAAADYLHLTQPTLSRQLMDLEEELGAKLFVRGNRKVTLTEEGMRLRRRASEILSLVEKAELEFRETEDQLRGEIHIGAGETDAIHLIAKAAREVQLRHPQIRYHLYSGNAEEVSEKLDKGLLDFGVLVEPINPKKYDDLRLPVTANWGVLIRKDDPMAEKEVIRPEDLVDKPLIVSKQMLDRGDLAHWSGKNEDMLQITVSYNLIYNASIMAEKGMGYALSLDHLVNTSCESKLCFRPLEPKLEIGLMLVWKKYTIFSPAAEYFLETLRRILEEERKEQNEESSDY